MATGIRDKVAILGMGCSKFGERWDASPEDLMLEAYNEAMADVEKFGTLDVPLRFRNAPTRLMKDLGYGKGYAYDHDVEGGFSGQDYFPDGMERRVFYAPKGEGAEARIKERLERWAATRKERS